MSSSKVELVTLNNQITRHASRKELSESVSIFRDLVAKGWANSHTYAAILNAYVRCGDIEGARCVFNQLLKSNVQLDVISCTTMMKGYCGLGDIGNAMLIFNKMTKRKKPVPPNIRTMNTLLRGCILAGTFDYGEIIYRKLKKFTISADISTKEYMVLINCQNLLHEKVLATLGHFNKEKDVADASAIANMYLHVARSAALLGDNKQARKSIQLALSFLEVDNNNIASNPETVVDSLENEDQIPGENVENSTALASGGKRSWHKQMDSTRAQSLEVLYITCFKFNFPSISNSSCVYFSSWPLGRFTVAIAMKKSPRRLLSFKRI